MMHLAFARPALPRRSRFRAALACLAIWAARRRQRLALRELDARRLQDIGLHRAEAEAEARKPFWRG